MALGLVALLAAGCGGGGSKQARELRVYFLLGGKVQPVLRIAHTEAVAGAALRALAEGPSDAERRALALRSAVPRGTDFSRLRIEQGVASLELPFGWDRSAVAQVVYTLTQFPSVGAVDIRGQRYTRADFEDVTPQILVESPLPFQTVRGPLQARGTANTFEATFEYELVAPDGLIVAHNFVTATSGSGERGTFEFTAPFTVERSGLGKLIVFERSAEDGSRLHEIAIPLRLER